MRLPASRSSLSSWAPLLAVALVAGLGTAGCGQVEQVGADRVLRVAVSEYRLNPGQAQAHAGTLTIVARNFGRLTHNLVITRAGQTRGTIRPLPPGQSGQMVVSLTPGTYQLASTILSDQALGTYARLTVTS